MARYRYKARDDEGHTISGSVEISSQEELRKRIENSGFFLVEATEEKGGLLGADLAKKFQRVTLRDLYSFTVQLNNTVGSGVPLLTSLSTIAQGSRNKKLRDIVEEVIQNLKAGSPLSKALARHPQLFSDFYISMIELGESSGKLSQTVGSLAEYIKKDMEIRHRIGSAMAYPICVAFIGAGLIGWILFKIMPEFVKVFSEEKVALPLPTIILLAISKMVTGYWYIVLLAFIAFAVWFHFFKKSDYGRLFLDKLKLRLPVLGVVVRKICAKRFIDGLYLLYVSGFPLLGALNIVKSMLNNKHLEKTIDALWVHISTGKDFASYLWLGDFFPPDVVAMIRSGEESGTLDKMLSRISELYHDEVNYSIEALISTFEILVIVFMGGLVGFAAMAIMFPILGMSRMVSQH